MFHGTHNDLFFLYFFRKCLETKKINIELFEALKTTRQTLTRNLIELLDQYGLRKNIIAYVKNEGLNLNALTNVFNFVVWCEIFGLEKHF